MPASLSSTQTSINSQAQTSVAQTIQTQTQSSASPSALQMASSMIPGVRRFPFAQTPNQAGQSNQSANQKLWIKNFKFL